MDGLKKESGDRKKEGADEPCYVQRYSTELEAKSRSGHRVLRLENHGRFVGETPEHPATTLQ